MPGRARGFAHVFLCVWCRRPTRLECPLAELAVHVCACGARSYVQGNRVQQWRPVSESSGWIAVRRPPRPPRTTVPSDGRPVQT